MPLSSIPRSDYDFSGLSSTVSTPLGNETLCHKSHQNRKSQISVLPSFKCPHCSAFFTSEQRVGYVLLSYGWILLMITGLTLTHPIGMPANVMVVGSVSRSQKI
jgi:thiosulfate reductase cytochrome b subunit